MKRQCKYAESLAVYRDLDFAARSSVDTHLRECPACTARLAAYHRVDQSLQALPILSLPAQLQQPWSRPLPSRQFALPDRRLRDGFGYVVGRVLLPVSLIIGLVAGVWFLLASLTDGDSQVIATPTLTLTPTATAAALLDGDHIAMASASPHKVAVPQPAALLPVARPTLVAAQVSPAVALHAP